MIKSSSALLALAWQRVQSGTLEMEQIQCDPSYCTGPQPNTVLTQIKDQYGCWCFFDSHFVHARGTSQDDIDSLCRNFYKSYKCIEMDAGEMSEECMPWDESYNTFQITDGVDVEQECSNANPSSTACALRACFVEHHFMVRLAAILIENPNAVSADYLHSGTFTHDDTCVGLGNHADHKECCGSYPQRYPYNTKDGERACCGGKTYGTQRLKCCDATQSKVCPLSSTSACDSITCQNGGTCDGGICICVGDFIGVSCELPIPCAADPCKNGGTCNNNADFLGFTCTCPTSFGGPTCEAISHCTTNPCLNDGACSESTDFSTFVCDCSGTGFSGTTCELSSQPCDSSPCLNGGTCTDVDSTTFSCACPVHYQGATCETVVPCSPNPCNGGLCADTGAGGTFNCACPDSPGARFTGTVCDIPLACNAAPCQNGNCVDDIGTLTFTCDCFAGFHGTLCDTATPCSASPCANGGSCADSGDFSTFTCTCASGFTGLTCDTPIPCDSSPCQNGGVCTNSGDFSTFTCTCASGFTGLTCDTPIPCDSSPCQNGGVCTNSGDFLTHTCACAADFTGANCETQAPCQATPSLCNTGVCTNSADLSTFTCDCSGTGFEGTNCETAESNGGGGGAGGDCTDNGDCQNNGCCYDDNGTNKCACPTGFGGATCGDPDTGNVGQAVSSCNGNECNCPTPLHEGNPILICGDGATLCVCVNNIFCAA